MEDAAYCATTLHKSSCASADPSDTETAAARDDAISDLCGMKDRLKGMLTHYEDIEESMMMQKTLALTDS